MDRDGFIQSLRAKGEADSQIQSYLSAHGDNNPLPPNQNAQSASANMGPSNPTPTTQPEQGNFLTEALPTIGGVAGGLLGGAAGTFVEPGGGTIVGGALGAGAGQAGGEWLKEHLQGKQADTGEILKQGAIGGVSDLAGGGLGIIGGKALSALGGHLVKTLGPDVFNGVVKASPNFVNDVRDLAQTASKYGLLEGETPKSGLDKMPEVMGALKTQIENQLTAVKTPVSLNSALTDFETQIGKSSSFDGSEAYQGAQSRILNRLLALNTGGDQTTASAIYKLKSDLGNELYPVFKKIDTGNGNLTPVEDMKYALWNSLKDTLDTAAPGIRGINTDQHNLFDISRAFYKALPKDGSGIAGEVARIPGDLAAALPLITSGNPVLGGAALIGSHLAQKALTSQTAGKIYSAVGPKLAGDAGKAITGAIGAGMAGPLAGSAVSQLSGPGGTKNGAQDNGNNKQGYSGNQSMPSSPNSDSIILSDGSKVNPNQPLSIPSGTSPIPELSGQHLMTAAEHKALLDKAGEDSIKIGKANDAYNADLQVKQSILANEGLNQEERASMRAMPTLWDQLGKLRQGIKSQGTGWINADPTVLAVRAQADPTGQYGALMALEQEVGGIQAKQAAGGRLSTFDYQMINAMPKPSDSTPTAIAKLNQAQAIMYQEYKRLYPYYTLGEEASAPISGGGTGGTGSTGGTGYAPTNYMPAYSGQ